MLGLVKTYLLRHLEVKTISYSQTHLSNFSERQYQITISQPKQNLKHHSIHSNFHPEKTKLWPRIMLGQLMNRTFGDFINSIRLNLKVVMSCLYFIRY